MSRQNHKTLSFALIYMEEMWVVKESGEKEKYNEAAIATHHAVTTIPSADHSADPKQNEDGDHRDDANNKPVCLFHYLILS